MPDRNLAAIAAFALAALSLTACGSDRSTGSGSAANTTEVVPTDNVTTSDTMVTNIVPATTLPDAVEGNNTVAETPLGNTE